MLLFILLTLGMHLVMVLTAAVMVVCTPSALEFLLRPRPRPRDNPPLARWANQYTRIERGRSSRKKRGCCSKGAGRWR